MVSWFRDIKICFLPTVKDDCVKAVMMVRSCQRLAVCIEGEIGECWTTVPDDGAMVCLHWYFYWMNLKLFLHSPMCVCECVCVYKLGINDTAVTYSYS